MVVLNHLLGWSCLPYSHVLTLSPDAQGAFVLSFSQPRPRELGVAQTTRQRGDEETGQSCPEMGGTLGHKERMGGS